MRAPEQGGHYRSLSGVSGDSSLCSRTWCELRSGSNGGTWQYILANGKTRWPFLPPLDYLAGLLPMKLQKWIITTERPQQVCGLQSPSTRAPSGGQVGWCLRKHRDLLPCRLVLSSPLCIPRFLPQHSASRVHLQAPSSCSCFSPSFTMFMLFFPFYSPPAKQKPFNYVILNMSPRRLKNILMGWVREASLENLPTAQFHSYDMLLQWRTDWGRER